MKVSLSWLNEYVNLSDQSTESISHALTMVGFEVEEVFTTGLSQLHHVVVGEILSFEKHPNADRLSLCQIDVGDGTSRSIICGAKNFKQNDRVIVALPGAVLPGDFKIKESKLRGVLSQGMLCSEKELGIGDNHDGIAILEDRPELGTAVNDLHPEPDTVFNVEVTPNRPDALSHIGIARELAAWFKLDLKYPGIGRHKASGEGKLIDSLECLSDEECPHYRGYSIRGVRVGESPAWLKARLLAIGLRPINNIVDVTNYVLHETGQPLHAFDVSKIKGGKIIVRSARKNETITTLDDKERKLDSSMLVIADAERPLVIAGVMGSVDAEVDYGSVDIFLETALFRASSIRKTSKSLNLSTDSSYRFERGIDPKGAEFAALRCIDLIVDLAGGEVLGSPLVFGDVPMTEKEIDISPNYIRDRFGFSITDDEIVSHLESLELSVSVYEKGDEGKLLRVAIPSHRLDLYRPIDLVEEVIRIYGSDKIPQSRVKATATLADDDPVVVFLRKSSETLVGQGYSEAVHYTLRSESELRNWYGHSQADSLSVANPLAQDASHLRTSLLPGLLDCLALNLARQNKPIRLFETGRVFREESGRIYELVSVAFTLLLDNSDEWKDREFPDFYTVAKQIQDIGSLAGINLDSTQFIDNGDENAWQKGHTAKVGCLTEGYFAKFGLLSPSMTREIGVRQPVLAGAIYLTPEFVKKPRSRNTFKPISSFPAAVRDLALICASSEASGRVKNHLIKVAEEVVSEAEFVLESVEVFDVYLGQGLPDGKKSVAFNLIFRSHERTLKDKEVNKIFDRIISEVEKNGEFSIRK